MTMDLFVRNYLLNLNCVLTVSDFISRASIQDIEKLEKDYIILYRDDSTLKWIERIPDYMYLFDKEIDKKSIMNILNNYLFLSEELPLDVDKEKIICIYMYEDEGVFVFERSSSNSLVSSECICDSFTIMNRGCNCGWVKARRAAGLPI